MELADLGESTDATAGDRQAPTTTPTPTLTPTPTDCGCPQETADGRSSLLPPCSCPFAEAGLTCNADRKCEFLATFTLVPPNSASQNSQDHSSTALKCAKRRLLVQHSRRPVRATRLNTAKQENQSSAASEPTRSRKPLAGELLDSDDERETRKGSRQSGGSRWLIDLQSPAAKNSSKFMLVYKSNKRVDSASKAPGRRSLGGKQTWAANKAASEKVVPKVQDDDELDESSVDIDIPTGLVINSLPDVSVKDLGFARLDGASRCFSVQKAPPTQFFVPPAKRAGQVTTCTVQPKTFRVPSKTAMLLTPATTTTARSKMKPPAASNSHLGAVSLMKLLPNSTVN